MGIESYALNANGIAEISNARDQVHFFLYKLVFLVMFGRIMIFSREITYICKKGLFLIDVVLKFLFCTPLVTEKQIGLSEQANSRPIIEFVVWRLFQDQSLLFQANQNLCIKQAFSKKLMTEVFIVAFSYVKYLFLCFFILWSFLILADSFMALLPILELMVSATVEGGGALATLKKSFFFAYLTEMRSILIVSLLSHCAKN